MKPYPLDTSNHLMTPLSSMTLATSSLISPIATRSVSIPTPDPLGPMLSAAVMTRLTLAAALSAWRRPPNPLSKLRISLGSPVQSDKCSLCKTLQPPVNIFPGGRQRHRRSMCDKRRQNLANIVADDEISDLVELGRLPIEND